MLKNKKTAVDIKERRKYNRYDELLKVTLCPSKYLFEHDALSHDISEGGICLFTNYKIEIDQPIKLKIYLPELKKPVLTLGKVIRRNETNDAQFSYLLGIQFTKISPEDHHKITNHLKYYIVKG